MILVTGGAGFIGANFVLDWLCRSDEPVLTLDKLTYAGNMNNLAAAKENPRHTFVEADINDFATVSALLHRYQPRAIIHFAAETHVDRSIESPLPFAQTNCMGTFHLLEATRGFWQTLSDDEQKNFRFIHISTDEVYGALTDTDPPFTEASPYAPNSPYAASKAAADHWARAFFHTYRLPVITMHSSNCYGPRQYPEKLIPLTIKRALQEQPIPIYGDGNQIRDWLYVDDFCVAIRLVLKNGRVGETYNVGGSAECANIDLVTTLCRVLDKERPRQSGDSYESLISFVPDRAGHDYRYAISTGKIQFRLGWRPRTSQDAGLRATARWYLENDAWLTSVEDDDDEW
jgi:dTDP-glucose 4,6-dehydratase